MYYGDGLSYQARSRDRKNRLKTFYQLVYSYFSSIGIRIHLFHKLLGKYGNDSLDLITVWIKFYIIDDYNLRLFLIILDEMNSLTPYT